MKQTCPSSTFQLGDSSAIPSDDTRASTRIDSGGAYSPKLIYFPPKLILLAPIRWE